MMIQSLIFALVLTSLLGEIPSVQGLTLSKIFTDHMVLQASPYVSSIWGNTDGPTESVAIKIKCQGFLTETVHIEPVRLTLYIQSSCNFSKK